jgi:hypothetical protein
VIMRADPHDRLMLPVGAPIGNRDHWEETPRLQLAFKLVVKRIRFLAGHGLLSLLVLGDILLRRITLSSHVSTQRDSSLGRATVHGLSMDVGLTWPRMC